MPVLDLAIVRLSCAERSVDTFFTIRSCSVTMTQQKHNLLECLVGVFNRQTIQPCFSG